MQKKGKSPSFFSLVAFLVVSSGIAISGEDSEVQELKEVEIIATPIVEGTETDDFANQKTVLTERQLDALNAYDLSSALRTSPGVTITRYNVVGSFGGAEGGAVFLRSMGSSRPGGEILTTVDGVPVGNAIWNHPLLDLVPITPASAIEIRKSAQPLQFGNAFGVVNIIPKRRIKEGFETQVEGLYGSFDTLMESVEHAGKIGKFDYAITQAYRMSDGHRDDSDGRLGDLSVRLGYELNENWEAALFTMYSESFARDPGPRKDPSAKEGTYETDQCLLTASLYNHYEKLHGSLKAYVSRGEGDWRDQAGNARNTLNEWVRYGALTKEAFSLWKGGEIVAGVDLDVLDGDARFTYDDSTPSRHFLAPQFVTVMPFVGVRQEVKISEEVSVIPSGGVRYYEHTYFSGEWSPHAGFVLRVKGVKFHGSYSRGVSYPGLNVVVFSEDVIPALGSSWRDLDAEKVDHFEVGVSRRWGEEVELGATFFHDEVEDRYEVLPPPPPPPTFVNIGAFRTTGVEVMAQARPIKDLSIFGSATYLKAKPSDVPYAPRWSSSGGVNLRITKQLTLNADIQFVDDMVVGSRARKHGAKNTSEIDSYVILNAKLSYRLSLGPFKSELFVAGENLTDEDYEYRPGYPMPGICVFGGAKISF